MDIDHNAKRLSRVKPLTVFGTKKLFCKDTAFYYVKHRERPAANKRERLWH